MFFKATRYAYYHERGTNSIKIKTHRKRIKWSYARIILPYGCKILILSCRSLLSFWAFPFLSQYFIMNINTNIQQSWRNFTENIYISTTYILLVTLHISIHLSIPLPINQSYILDALQSKLQTLVHFPVNI